MHHAPQCEAILQEQSLTRYARYQPRAFQIGNGPADSFDRKTKMIGNVLM
jgi:hypothetical protein